MTEQQHLYNLLKSFSTAMLVTHASDGKLRARPMAIARVDEDCHLWFLTSAESAKAHEIEADTHVHVVCQNDRAAYLSMSGTATLSRDRDKIKELWQESFAIWFPTGADDPDIALISVRPEEGEYWDNEGFNRIKYLLQAARAYAAGEKPELEEGQQHGRVTL